MLAGAVVVFVVLPLLVVGGNQAVVVVIAEFDRALVAYDGNDVACAVIVKGALVRAQCLANQLSVLVVMTLLLAAVGVCPRLI